MIDGTVILLHFVLCGTQVCGGPNVAEKTFESTIACRAEVRARLAKEENHKDIYACVLADRWIEEPKGVPRICKPYSNAKDCVKP